jgi:transcriptional regulator with XRE-family HTH domain
MWAWLAYDLRFYREKHKLSGEAFGKIIGAVRSTVSRMEYGDLKIDEKQAKAIDDHLDTGGHFLRLLTYAKLGHHPDWFKEHLGYETRASLLRIFELSLVPGLLQTEEYAHALFKSAGERDIDAQLAQRMSRQTILTRDPPPSLWILLDEQVLRRAIGGPRVMRAQLARLLEVADQPDVILRVIPASTGYHLGLEGSTFKILTVAEGDVAYTEATGGGRLILGTDEVRSFALRYDRIGAKALPEDPSRSLIAQVMEAIA